MAATYRNVGPDRQDEVPPQRARHDLRRSGVKIGEMLRTPVGGLMCLMVMGVFSAIVPSVADILFLIGLGTALFIRSAQKNYTLPARIPRHSNIIDPLEINPGTGKPGLARGTFYIGNDRVSGEEVWLTNRDAGVHMLVLGTTGSGKALRLDEPILTPDGFKLMRDIQVGDLVMHQSGEPTRVLGVFPQGELQLFRITFEDGRFMDVSGDHLWEVHGKQKTVISCAAFAHPQILTTNQIMDQLAVNRGNLSVPLYAPDLSEIRTLDFPISPYLLGALLGAGSIRKENLVFTCDEASITERVRQELSHLGMRLHHRHEHQRSHYDVIQCTVDGNDVQNHGFCRFSQAIQSIGVLGRSSHDKFIPSLYFSASARSRLDLVRGLMDTNGVAGIAGSVSYKTSSPKLAEDVSKLLRSLGAVVQVQAKEKVYICKDEKPAGCTSYLLHIKISDPSSLFTLHRKADLVREHQCLDPLKLGIKSVVPLDKLEGCQCIKVEAKDGLFVAGDYIVTHNTEMLLGLCQNALNQGSGFMFVDGKAQDKIAFKIQDLCRARGRDDDVLILNFMTGARDIIGPQPNKITNTMNPFSYGSSGMISQIVVGLMASGGGGDDMWKDRAISFVEAISPPLTYLRDNYGLILDVNEYRRYFELDRLEEMCWKGAEKYPGLSQVLDPIRNYMINLPGYDEKKYGKKGGQGDDTKLQHGFITMQLVRAFTSLADTYGHIVRVPLGEVYFPDLVKQRRILIAMLPSLEKTPSETANIGKIIVTALRNIMAEGLGSTLEGSRDDLDNDDGRALLPPYVVILDEYGYYAVKGFAVAFAQARSLGFVCVVGGQDLASFQRESKEEAVSICGNTRIKAFGSIEDPDQTMDFVIKTSGKALVAETSSYEGDMGMLSMNYADQLNIHLKAVERVDPSDIKEQIEGQFTFVWRSRVIRAQTYYVNPKKVKRVQLNHFLQVPPPDTAQLLEISSAASGLAEKIEAEDLRMLSVACVRDLDLAVATMHKMIDSSPIERSIAAIVAVGRDHSRHAQNFRQSVRSAPSAASKILHDDDPDEFDADTFLSGVSHQNPESEIHSVQASSAASSYGDEDENEDDGLFDGQSDVGFEEAQMMDDVDIKPFPKMNVFLPKKTGFGADVFAEESNIARDVQDALTGPEESAPMLNYNTTFKGVEQIERALGATMEEAGAAARDVVKGIEDATRYPQSTPMVKSSAQVSELLNDLLDAL